MLTLDGSFGEGGGQILRTSLSLSAITGQPFALENIRANRRKPGLRQQHMTAVRAMAELCDAEVTGARIGSDRITFAPTTLPSGEHTFDIGTAGSTSLLLHALAYPMLQSESGGTLHLLGGTHNPMAPTALYNQEVWAPLLRTLGYDVSLQLHRYGFYPKGGGAIEAHVASVSSHPLPEPWIWTERPPLDRLEIHAFFAAPPHQKKSQARIPERMAEAAQKTLQRDGWEAEIHCHEVTSASVGAVCHVLATFGPLRAGFTAFGERGLPAEKVGKATALDALTHLHSPACLDPWAADQLLLPLALARTPATFTTSDRDAHLETNATIIQRFLPHFHFQIDDLGPHEIQIQLGMEAEASA